VINEQGYDMEGTKHLFVTKDGNRLVAFAFDQPAYLNGSRLRERNGLR